MSDLLVVLEVEEAEETPAVAVELVEVPVVLRADASDHTTIAARQEELGIAVLEERVQLAVEVCVALELERWDPRRAGVQPVGQVDESF